MTTYNTTMQAVLTLTSNLVLFSGFGCFSYTFYLRRREIYFQQLFKRIEKSQKYHLDYVDSIDQLPEGKSVLLFGTARSLTKEKIIAKSYIRKSGEEDRIWNYLFKDAFQLATSGNELIDIVPPADEENILAFNLPKNNEDAKYEERVIHHNQPISTYGTIHRVGEKGRKLQPELIMGARQQKILQFLDKEILRINGKGRTFLIVGTGLFISHFIYQTLWGKKSKKQQNIEKVLSQMK